MNPRFVVAATAALFLGAAAAPGAQPTPVPSASPIALPPIPPAAHLDPYAREAIDILAGAVARKIDELGNSDAGRVTYFKRFDMQIATGANAYRNVRLHPGTVIDPRGESIAVGQRVEVSGRRGPDGALDADTITIDH